LFYFGFGQLRFVARQLYGITALKRGRRGGEETAAHKSDRRKRLRNEQRRDEMAENGEKTNAEAAAFWERGNEHLNKKEYDAAIEAYTTAIRLKPDYAEAFNNRGIAYDNKGDYDKAIADFDAAMRLKTDYALAFNNRGLVYYFTGDYGKAIADYNEATGLKPDYAGAFLGRGLAYRNKGDDKNCFLDFKEAANRDSQFAPWFTEFVDEKIKGGIDWFLTAFTYEELGTALHPFLRTIAFCKKRR
jgi:tetratricopeptide (TPR) repeat protein